MTITWTPTDHTPHNCHIRLCRNEASLLGLSMPDMLSVVLHMLTHLIVSVAVSVCGAQCLWDLQGR